MSSKPAATPSCERCSIRKVKCDRQQPKCSACDRHNAECLYQVLPPPRRKKRRDPDKLLTGRLKQCGRSLHPKSIHPDASTESLGSRTSPPHAGSGNSTTKDDQHLPQLDSTTTESRRVTYKTRLLHDQDRSKFLDNGLWTRVVKELAEPADALGYSSEEDGDKHDVAEDSMDFVLGLTPTPVSIESSHPPANKIFELWNVFLERVDPLTKVVHGPTLQPAVHKAVLDLSSIPKSLEALLFAIYSAAVVSLKNHECEQRFGESRKALSSRYWLATRAALSRAKFIGSANLAVLQAFLIHLMSARDAYDSRTLWTLTGLALRIAEGMGLHRDGSFLELPLFETEIRRRMWWQLKMLDSRSAELSGSDKFGTLDTDPRIPKLPANINDDELYPSMSSFPTKANRATDMVFCSLRFEMRSFGTINTVERRQQGNDGSLWDSSGSNADLRERDKAIDELEKILEAKYARYCDPSQPIQLMALLVARGAVSIMRLIAHHPRRWRSEEQVPETERQNVWDLSMKLLRQYHMVNTSRELERFSWHAGFYFQWHAGFYFQWQAFIHVLDTLRINPLVQEATEVWQLIDEMFETYPGWVTNTKKATYVAVGNLCLKAYSAREAALAKEGNPIPPAPSYIKTFRSQREAASERRRGQEAANKKAEVLTTVPHAAYQSRSMDTESRPDLKWEPFGNWPILPKPPQNTAFQFVGTEQSQPSTGSNTFWFPNHNAESASSASIFMDDYANMELDLLLAQDTNTEDPITQNIDWVKWDALLGNLK